MNSHLKRLLRGLSALGIVAAVIATGVFLTWLCPLALAGVCVLVLAYAVGGIGPDDGGSDMP
jgi:uncharacterized protein (DUF2062 family)